MQSVLQVQLPRAAGMVLRKQESYIIGADRFFADAYTLRWISMHTLLPVISIARSMTKFARCYGIALLTTAVSLRVCFALTGPPWDAEKVFLVMVGLLPS